jgi:quercetin dioxygenase-like cupin family protein
MGAALAQSQSLDPLAADPQHYTKEIENQWVRVIREHMAPHEKMTMHQHPAPGAVIILLTDRHNRLIAPDGKSQELGGHAGDAMWSLPSTHRSENLSDTPFEGIQIEPRRPAGAAPPFVTGKLDAPALDPRHYHVEFENEYVRILRVNIGPHEKLVQHTHPNTGAILVQLTDQDLRLTLADGTVRTSKFPAGKARWVEPGPAHQDENLADTPLKFLRVELKLAAPSK